MTGHELTLTLLNEELAVCRLDPDAEIPAWAGRTRFCSITRTADELSVISPETDIPEDVVHHGGWRGLKIEGPFEFTAVGVLASVAAPLAEAGISILAIATYDTDYLLVADSQLERAEAELAKRGHRVRRHRT